MTKLEQKKTIVVSPYSEQWPEKYEKEATLIKTALANNCLNVHHVGSTSVPGLDAKPVIDIIVETNDQAAAIRDLENIGYTFKGEYNIPFRAFFSKKEPYEVHLHVYEPGHPEVDLNLRFRNYLRKHPEFRLEYALLKYKLLENPQSYIKQENKFSGYNLGKNAFIQSVIKASGFDGLCMRLCAHDAEWNDYARIRAEQFKNHTTQTKDIDYASLPHETNHHLVLCRGVNVVSIAHVEMNHDQAFLRILATDELAKGKGYAGHMLTQIIKWLSRKDMKSISVTVPAREHIFYEKHGFITNDALGNPDQMATFEIVLK